MYELFEEIFLSLKNGKDLVLATIITESGSTPRTSGSKMVVYDDASSLSAQLKPVLVRRLVLQQQE